MAKLAGTAKGTKFTVEYNTHSSAIANVYNGMLKKGSLCLLHPPQIASTSYMTLCKLIWKATIDNKIVVKASAVPPTNEVDKGGRLDEAKIFVLVTVDERREASHRVKKRVKN